VRTRISIGLLALLLTACAGEQVAETPAASDTDSRPACVPDHQICGIEPPQRRVDGGTAYKLTTVAGDSFWATVPGEPTSAVAVPSVPLRVNAGVTTFTPREAAGLACSGFRACEPTPVDRAGALTRWDDASGTIADLELTTVDLGQWTLAILDPDAARAKRVARSLHWTTDDDGYPRVNAPDDAHVSLWLDKTLLDISPGCKQSTLQIHPADTVKGGRWCTNGSTIDASFVDRPELERLHDQVEIVDSAP
jgi:hypothetical protein